jgi:hypothetical protein
LEYARGLLQHYEIRLAEELRMYRRTGLSTHHEGVFQLRKIIHDVEKRIKELEEQSND